MAGFATDSSTRTFTVKAGPHTVVVTEESDGVNEPEYSATVDGESAEVTIGGEVLIDGLHSEPIGSDRSDGQKVAETIREVYGDDEPTVARFETEEFDNGFFFTDYPDVVLANSEVDHYSFEDAAGDLSEYVARLSAEYGPLGAHAQMTVDLFTGEVEVDEYGSLF